MKMKAKYAGRCAECGAPFKKGDPILYYGRKKAYGVGCHIVDKEALAAKRAARIAREKEAINRAFCELAGLDYEEIAERIAVRLENAADNAAQDTGEPFGFGIREDLTPRLTNGGFLGRD